MRTNFLARPALIAALVLSAGGAAIAQPAPAPAGASSLNAVDRMFVIAAAKAGTEEVSEGRVESGSSDAAAAAFAQRMVRDHSKANAQLKSIARSLGAAPEVQRGVAEAAPPHRMPGAVYLRKEAGNHKQAIALFEKEANSGGNAALRNYAEQTIPVLRSHLTQAEKGGGS